MGRSNTSLFADMIAAVFILLFAYTAISKSLHLDNFIFTLKRSPLIGNLATILAFTIITIESIIVTLLFFPLTRQLGLLASVLLMLGFTGYVGYMIFSDNRLPCSCGGIINRLSWQQHFILNLILTVLAFFTLVPYTSIRKLKYHAKSLLQ